jgi:diacylglycerol O-acyltransferase / wax synthase
MELDTSTVPGGYTFERLHDALSLRIGAMPRFREKLANNPLNLDHPVWVDDDDFHVDRHLHRIELPAPGGRAELSAICGHIASLSLDRGRPLWEMWVIEGVAGTDCHREGRPGVMSKVHHSGMDGVTGANLMSQLCTAEADAPTPDPVDGVAEAAVGELPPAVWCGLPPGRCSWQMWCRTPCPRWSGRCSEPAKD